jgi:plastocyanin
MRILFTFMTLVVSTVASLSVAYKPARACDPYYIQAGRMYYRPMTTAYGQQYYAPPMYYARPAQGYSAARPTTTVSVAAYDNSFQPSTINVQPGTTVRFVNSGRHTHTVTSNDNRFDSGDLAPGASYSVTFTNPGTFTYYCRHHAREKMQGTIVVGSASAGTTPARAGY